MSETTTPDAINTRLDRQIRFMTGWCALAGLSQLFFLTNWPLYVLDVRIGFWPAICVSLARLGVYLGLAWGLERRLPEAWAVTLLELLRTFILAIAPVVLTLLQREPTPAAFYPAAWAQGLLGGALPLVEGVATALALGWRPGAVLESVLGLVVRVCAAFSFALATWLWREHAAFHVLPERRVITLLRLGLPLVLALSLAEGAALFLSGGALHPQAAAPSPKPGRPAASHAAAAPTRPRSGAVA